VKQFSRESHCHTQKFLSFEIRAARKVICEKVQVESDLIDQRKVSHQRTFWTFDNEWRWFKLCGMTP
jgi:hypothetical protein